MLLGGALIPATLDAANWADVLAHKSRADNPHGVTLAQVAPGNCGLLGAIDQSVATTASPTFAGLKTGVGLVGINQPTPTAQMHVNSSAIDKPAGIFDCLAGQTANIYEWKIAGVNKVWINSNGALNWAGGAFNGASGLYVAGLQDLTSGSNAKIIFGATAKYLRFNTNNTDWWQVATDGTFTGMNSTPGLSTNGTNKWKFGAQTAGSELTLNTSSYLAVTVDGVAYKLALIN